MSYYRSRSVKRRVFAPYLVRHSGRERLCSRTVQQLPVYCVGCVLILSCSLGKSGKENLFHKSCPLVHLPLLLHAYRTKRTTSSTFAMLSSPTCPANARVMMIMLPQLFIMMLSFLMMMVTPVSAIGGVGGGGSLTDEDGNVQPWVLVLFFFFFFGCLISICWAACCR